MASGSCPQIAISPDFVSPPSLSLSTSLCRSSVAFCHSRDTRALCVSRFFLLRLSDNASVSHDRISSKKGRKIDTRRRGFGLSSCQVSPRVTLNVSTGTCPNSNDYSRRSHSSLVNQCLEFFFFTATVFLSQGHRRVTTAMR